MNTFLQPGVFADHTPAAAVTAGDIINNVGPGVGVADNDIAANEKGAVRCAGVYSVDNPDDTAFAYGINPRTTNTTFCQSQQTRR